MAKKIPTQDEKNAYHELRTIANNNLSIDHIVLEQIKSKSFIQMCTILEKDCPNDTEFGNKIRKYIKTFNQNNNT